MHAAFLLLPLLVGVHSRGLKFGPIAEANHAAESTLGCDPDYGWSDGADGTGKCYMLIKNFDYSTCYSDGGVGGYGMSWFDAMECCYYNKGYLAEPQSADEQAKIEEYIQIADGGTLGLSAWWLGGNDMHQEGAWSWPSGQPFGYSNWVEGEPDDSNGLEDCIAIDSPKNYQWMDLNCTDPLHGAVTHFAVCERIPA